MSRREEQGDRLDEAYWEVNAAASRLISQGCWVSSQALRDRRLQMEFDRELAYYARRVVDDVYYRKLSPEEALEALDAESKSLRWQEYRIMSQVLGLIGGAGQVIAGGSMCVGTVGVGCVVGGGALLAHGGNNLYENGRGLYEGRNDVEGPVRKAYQHASEYFGFSSREGNMAYLSSDIAISLGALGRKVLKPGAWKLFKYYQMDKEAIIRQMGVVPLLTETAVNGSTARQLYEESKK
ncbi:DUF4225 domain-containing protein [Pseudomonas sp. NPDC089401]|uniref:DUF4225 domain-containing protein n=1 Tax=Pseudomonas sp. NPDC089401 TaxID=3364462 RepID=UPI003821942E